MNCEKVREHLPLLLYGELAPAGRAALEDHLEACAGCRAAWEQEVALHRLLEEREADPPPGLLARCRQELAREITRRETGQAPGRGSLLGRWWQAARETLAVPRVAWKPLGALALVAVGFFAARWTQPAAAPGVVDGSLPAWWRQNGEPARLTRIRAIEAGEGNRLRIRVEEIRERVVQGTPHSEAVRALLLEALRESSDPGVRGESLELLKQDAGASDVRVTLLYVLRHDPNPGVRLKALEGLTPFAADAQVRAVLKEVLLGDDNPALRIQAIELLSSHPETRIIPVLQELLAKEQNVYIRARCEELLREWKASAEIF